MGAAQKGVAAALDTKLGKILADEGGTLNAHIQRCLDAGEVSDELKASLDGGAEALGELLKDHPDWDAEATRNLGLSKVFSGKGDVLWVCDECKKSFEADAEKRLVADAGDGEGEGERALST